MKHTEYRYDSRLNATSILREQPPLITGGAGDWDDDWEDEDWDDDDWEDEEIDGFLRYLHTIESEPSSTLARQLLSDGIALPAPATFNESSVHPKLWEIIHGLARRRTYLSSTDHLSDLELYRYLWEVTLSEPAHELDDRMGDCACHIDLVSDGSQESIWLWLRYYADEATRQEWTADFPGDHIPDHLAPPHDRDRHLPKWEPALRP